MTCSSRSSFRLASLGAIALMMLAACASPRHASAPPSPHYKVGAPYKINGRWYHPAADPDYEEIGVASWYGRQFHGKPTANGEIFDMNRLSAAHTTLPLPSIVEVENLANGRTLAVRVNDRGPFAKNRIIDVSREVARRLGFEEEGLARVRVRYLGPASVHAVAPRRPEDVLRQATAPQRRTVVAAAARSVSAAPSQPGGVIPASYTIGPAAEPLITPEPSLPTPPAAPAPANPQIAMAEGANAVGETLYIIRVAALSRLDNLEALKAQMAPIGPLRVSRLERNSGAALYRITMGPFPSAESAAERLERVRAAGYGDASVVALQP